MLTISDNTNLKAAEQNQVDKDTITSTKTENEKMVMSAELDRKGTAETTYKNNFHARSLGQKKRWSEMKKLKLAQMEENKR